MQWCGADLPSSWPIHPSLATKAIPETRLHFRHFRGLLLECIVTNNFVFDFRVFIIKSEIHASSFHLHTLSWYLCNIQFVAFKMISASLNALKWTWLHGCIKQASFVFSNKRSTVAKFRNAHTWVRLVRGLYLCMYICMYRYIHIPKPWTLNLTCKRGSVGQSEGLLIPSIPSKSPRTQIPMDLNYIDPQSSVLNYCWK